MIGPALGKIIETKPHIRRILAVALAFTCAASSGQAISSTIVAPVSAVASSQFTS